MCVSAPLRNSSSDGAVAPNIDIVQPSQLPAVNQTTVA